MSDEIAKRLQQARAEAGFKTASDAARRFGWNENTYRSHENGERGLKRDVAFKYARAFGVSPAFIMIDASYANLDFSGTWRFISGQVDDTGSTNIKKLLPTSADTNDVAIFDIAIDKRIIALEYVGPRDFGIFTKGDLIIFEYLPDGIGEVGQYCLIEYEPKKYVVRILREGPEEGTIDISQRLVYEPELVRPLWLGSLYLLIPRGRWDKDDAKKFVNRASDPRSP